MLAHWNATEGFDVPWWVWIPLVVVGLITLDRLALAAEARGWIYWRHNTPSRSSAGHALQSVQAIFEPQREHIVHEQSQIGADQPDDGEPPDPPDRRTSSRAK